MPNLHVNSFRITKGTFDELLATLQAPGGLVDILRAAEGFIRYGIVDLGSGELTTISVWTSGDAAAAASPLVVDWMRTHLADRIEGTYMAVGDFALLVEG